MLCSCSIRSWWWELNKIQNRSFHANAQTTIIEESWFHWSGVDVETTFCSRISIRQEHWWSKWTVIYHLTMTTTTVTHRRQMVWEPRKANAWVMNTNTLTSNAFRVNIGANWKTNSCVGYFFGCLLKGTGPIKNTRVCVCLRAQEAWSLKNRDLQRTAKPRVSLLEWACCKTTFQLEQFRCGHGLAPPGQIE